MKRPPAPPPPGDLADALIEHLHRALYDALRAKPDGSRHHFGCLNRTVNASPTPCSVRCRYAAEACQAAEAWRESAGAGREAS